MLSKELQYLKWQDPARIRIGWEWYNAKQFQVHDLTDYGTYSIVPADRVFPYLTKRYIVSPIASDGTVCEGFTGDGATRMELDKLITGEDIPPHGWDFQPKPVNPIPKPEPIGDIVSSAKTFAKRLADSSGSVPIVVLLPDGKPMACSRDGSRLSRLDTVRLKMLVADVGIPLPDGINGEWWTILRRYLEDSAPQLLMMIDAATGQSKGLSVGGTGLDGGTLYIWRK
jgi:hypothetical protein